VRRATRRERAMFDTLAGRALYCLTTNGELDTPQNFRQNKRRQSGSANIGSSFREQNAT
jgi:hypothetical protein